MSVLVGARERTASFPTALANTNVTTCYTNAGQQATKGLAVHIGNESAGTVVVLIYWYNAAAATAYFMHGESIATLRGYTYDLQALRLDRNDEIRVKADNLVDVVVTVTEFQGPG